MAVTGDDGGTWNTERLDRFAPPGFEHLAFADPSPFQSRRTVATVDGTLVVVAQGARGKRRYDGPPAEAKPSPIVFVRVTPADG